MAKSAQRKGKARKTTGQDSQLQELLVEELEERIAPSGSKIVTNPAPIVSA